MSTSERISSIEQGVEAFLEESDIIAQPASKRNGNETTLPFTVEEANDNGKATLDPDESPVQPSKKGVKDKESRFNWFNKPLVTFKLSPASLLASLAVILGLSVATYYGVSTASTSTIVSEHIASPTENPGTIILNADGGMTISGYVKLSTNIEVPGELPSLVAITLADGAVLDCDNHSIIGGDFSSTNGIKVEVEGGDGTQIKNCDVTGFQFGAQVSGSFSIEKSSFRSNNSYGIFAFNLDSPRGVVLKMKEVTVEDNGSDGIYLDNLEDVKLDNVVTNGNKDFGILVSRGGEVILEDITAEQNGVDGVQYTGNRLTLKGKNSLSNNGEDGLNIKGVSGTTVSVDAKAKVAVNNNGKVGIRVETDADFVLAKKASLEACYNGDDDWDAEGGTTFTGKKYICDDINSNGDGPDCKPCK